MATPKETIEFTAKLESLFGVPVTGGLYNAMKKLLPVEQRLVEDYIGKVVAEFRTDHSSCVQTRDGWK